MPAVLCCRAAGIVRQDACGPEKATGESLQVAFSPGLHDPKNRAKFLQGKDFLLFTSGGPSMLDLLLTGGAQWFAGVAFIATLLFGVTVLLMFVGGDGGVDAGADLDLDVPDGSGSDTSSFKILSFQGVIGFGMGWGWGGLVALRSMGWSWNAAAVFGIAIGVIFLRMLWVGFRLVYSLNGSGNVRRAEAVGHTGTVTVAIPPSGSGRVRVVIRNRQREYRASAGGRAVAPQAAVRVTGMRDDCMLEVEPA